MAGADGGCIGDQFSFDEIVARLAADGVRVLALIWGLILAQLRQLPGRGFLPVRFVTIAYIDVFRGVPLLIMILLISGSIPSLQFLPEWLRIPQWFGKPDNFWFGVYGYKGKYGKKAHAIHSGC